MVKKTKSNKTFDIMSKYDYNSPDGNYTEDDHTCPYCGDPVEDDGDFCNPQHRKWFNDQHDDDC